MCWDADICWFQLKELQARLGRLMSLPELERLVEEAEGDRSIRKILRACRTRPELILAARRLGYRITRFDLQRAYGEHLQQQQGLALAFPRTP